MKFLEKLVGTLMLLFIFFMAVLILLVLFTPGNWAAR